METDIFKHIKIIIYKVFVKMTKQHIFIIENNLQKVGQSFFFTCPVGQPWYKIYLSDVSFN